MFSSSVRVTKASSYHRKREADLSTHTGFVFVCSLQAELSPHHLLSYPGVSTTHVWAWAPEKSWRGSTIWPAATHTSPSNQCRMLAPLASVSVSFGMGILQRSHQMNGTVNLPVSPGLSVQQRGLSVLMFIKKVTRLSFVLQTLICEICMERTCICTYTYMWMCICTYTYMWQFFTTNLRWALSTLEKRRHEVKVTRDGCWEIRWTSAALQTLPQLLQARCFTGGGMKSHEAMGHVPQVLPVALSLAALSGWYVSWHWPSQAESMGLSHYMCAPMIARYHISVSPIMPTRTPAWHIRSNFLVIFYILI